MARRAAGGYRRAAAGRAHGWLCWFRLVVFVRTLLARRPGAWLVLLATRAQIARRWHMLDVPDVISAAAKRGPGKAGPGLEQRSDARRSGAAAGSASGAGGKGRRGIDARRARTALWLLLPTLLAIALVAGYPLLRTIYLSFTDYNLSSGDEPHWVGFENYWNVTEDGINIGLLADPAWWGSVWNTVVLTISSVGMESLLGLGFALVINSKIKGRGLVRTAILVPWAIPTVVSAQMWNWMYQDSLGIVSSWGRHLGLLKVGQSVLSNPDTALWALVAIDVWKTTPFMALLLLAGLQSIPTDLYEAASVDGATRLQQFWRITLPSLAPALLVAVIFRTLDALRIFDMPYVVKGNAPETMTMSMYARQQMIDNAQFGMGSSVSVLIFVVIMVFTVAYMTLSRVNLEDTRP
jgi:trehalose/maltose transport system permease protein